MDAADPSIDEQFAAQNKREESNADKIAQARNHLNASEYDQARQLCQEVLANNPSQFHLAGAYLVVGASYFRGEGIEYIRAVFHILNSLAALRDDAEFMGMLREARRLLELHEGNLREHRPEHGADNGEAVVEQGEEEVGDATLKQGTAQWHIADDEDEAVFEEPRRFEQGPRSNHQAPPNHFGGIPQGSQPLITDRGRLDYGGLDQDPRVGLQAIPNHFGGIPHGGYPHIAAHGRLAQYPNGSLRAPPAHYGVNPRRGDPHVVDNGRFVEDPRNYVWAPQFQGLAGNANAPQPYGMNVYGQGNNFIQGGNAHIVYHNHYYLAPPPPYGPVPRNQYPANVFINNEYGNLGLWRQDRPNHGINNRPVNNNIQNNHNPNHPSLSANGNMMNENHDANDEVDDAMDTEGESDSESEDAMDTESESEHEEASDPRTPSPSDQTMSQGSTQVENPNADPEYDSEFEDFYNNVNGAGYEEDSEEEPQEELEAELQAEDDEFEEFYNYIRGAGAESRF